MHLKALVVATQSIERKKNSILRFRNQKTKNENVRVTQ